MACGKTATPDSMYWYMSPLLPLLPVAHAKVSLYSDDILCVLLMYVVMCTEMRFFAQLNTACTALEIMLSPCVHHLVVKSSTCT